MQYVEIYGDVTDKTLADVQNAIASEDKDITLLIDSLGGSLQAGLSIFDCITTCPKEKHTFYARCKGNVASSATLILCAIPKENRTATLNTCFLIHNPLVSLYGPTNMGEIKQLANTMESANEQIKSIYRLRTNMDDELMDALMTSETEFYGTKAVEYGLIGHIEQIQNKRTNYKQNKLKNKKTIMKKTFLQNLTNRLVKALLNEAYVAEDGSEVNIEGELAIGTPAQPDGIYVIEGVTVTVENGAIVDVIPAEAPAEETPAEEIENEGEGEEAPAEETPAEVAETVAEEVEEVVSEEEVTDATEIASIVKEIVEGELAELEELKDLVSKCGGKEKLQKLANVKHQSKVFNAEAKKENKGTRSIAELVAMKKK